jgi:acetyl esterase/lipase
MTNDAFAAGVRQAGAPLALYDYPGAGHLFADPDLPDVDLDAEALMLDRVLGALDRMGRRGPRA